VTLAAFGFGVAAFAQQDEGSRTATIKVQTQIVVLDVAATDAQGRAVLDLRPEEFRVYEKNVPQVVRSFEPPTAHELPPDQVGKLVVDSTADLGKIVQAPITVLILDELNMNFQDEVYERDKVTEWLKRQPAILPQPTALMAATYSQFVVVRDFTQSRDALLEALRKHSGGVLWRTDSNGRVGSQASENMFATMGALEQVAQAMRGVPGRKNVLWVGNGFPAVNLGDVGRTSANEIDAAMRHLSTVMLHARVTLTVIGGPLMDFHPVVVETQSDADMMSSTGGDGLSIAQGGMKFANLAPPTGGHAYSGQNDIAGAIARTIDGGSHYYTLSYRPSDPSSDPTIYRRIRVEVTRPGVTVETRDGYFEEPRTLDPAAKVPMQQLAFDLNGAAASSMSYTDLHVSAERRPAGVYPARRGKGYDVARASGWTSPRRPGDPGCVSFGEEQGVDPDVCDSMLEQRGTARRDCPCGPGAEGACGSTAGNGEDSVCHPRYGRGTGGYGGLDALEPVS
jgi:VWFA-related protein